LDEWDERQRFETLLRHVEIEGEAREDLIMQRVVGFYAGLVVGVPIPLATLLLLASRPDARPAPLLACLALLVFGPTATAFLGAALGPYVVRCIDEAKARREK
jgi:hypothetical protein